MLLARERRRSDRPLRRPPCSAAAAALARALLAHALRAVAAALAGAALAIAVLLGGQVDVGHVRLLHPCRRTPLAGITLSWVMTTESGVVAKLVENHREFLAFLEKRVSSRAEAEDILQEAFVKSMQRQDALRDDESAVSWFYRMLRNAVIDRHRRRAAAARGIDALAREMSDEQPPQEFVETACSCVRRLSETLKPEYAEALARVEVDGVAVKEYAEQIGITASNAAVRVHRARAALKQRVFESCGTCAEHGCVDCTC